LSNEHKSETSDVFLSPKKLLGDCSFNFLQECLFCAQKCIVSCPTKNPNQWREAYSCITTADGKVTSNEAMLRHLHERNDTWGREVASRVNLAVSDLYAADARYHRDCIAKFFTSNPSAGCYTKIGDSALNELLVQMSSDFKRAWNSLESDSLYSELGGTQLSWRSLIKSVQNHFQSNSIVLSFPHVDSILVF